eukprot:6420860-Amphidinium_carterae.1
MAEQTDHQNPQLVVNHGVLLVDSEQCFAKQAPISDHLPQTYAIHERSKDGKSTTLSYNLLSWNVMCRGRAGGKGRDGTVLEGQTLTNNGLEHDETADAYQDRMLTRVVPILSNWFAGTDAGTRPKIACLQEFPQYPLLQDEMLSRLHQLSQLHNLQLALRPTSCAGVRDEEGGVWCPSSCTAFIWDRAALPHAKILETLACDLGALPLLL